MREGIIDLVGRLNDLIVTDVVAAYNLVSEVSRNGHDPEDIQYFIARFGIALSNVYGPQGSLQLLVALHGGEFGKARELSRVSQV